MVKDLNIKDLNIIIYKNKCYRLFTNNRTLFISENNNIIKIHSGVLYYTMEYYEDSLWICYYDEKYSVFISKIELEVGIRKKIETNLLFLCNKNLKSLDSLSLLIKDNHIDIIFRGCDRHSGKIYIFKSNINMCTSPSIIDISDYNSSFKICKTDNEDLILICKNFEEGEYVLYDLLTNKHINDFYLPNISNISFINYNKKPLIFYNGLIERDLSIKYRNVIINEGNGYLDNEHKLPLPKNIIKPQISIYMGNVYVIWNNTNNVNIALSNDLNTWKFSCLSKKNARNLVKANIMKIVDNKCENIKTYINFSQLYKLFKLCNNDERNEIFEGNTDNYKNIANKNDIMNEINCYKLKTKFLKERYLNLKLEALEEIQRTEIYYEDICREYLNTINNLVNIIEEKDRIIFKLLNI
ncbi:hypothetical protein [Clostridium colicanis]|uniref:Uncharacterized protein n=3 Tax=Clostridium TaxID=1485 RepID=A0A151ARB1_9CLOT|nr:hypothetical protein [Clostridium colicanis]KYH30179.1 hypothetical protein CLCOL_01170 [Clostridium colicanis DSM 13634]PRR76676.1 hypothetical protein CPAL_00610 [Clostridium thermopalmarium DSM 5974]PVZ23011.1 hypothetical protein LX19_01665 [Clostridium thermopalmarium DSM 5974]